MLGKIEGWRRGATEDYRLNGREFEPTLGDGKGQGGLAGCSPWIIKMATHSSILAWRVPWTEEPGGLQSIGLQKHDLAAEQQQLYLGKGEREFQVITCPTLLHDLNMLPPIPLSFLGEGR